MKWTNTKVGVDQISGALNKLAGRPIVRISLRDGGSFEGVVRSLAVENNLPTSSKWSVRGHVSIETIGREPMTFDLADVVNVEDLFDQKKDQYVAAGMIRIVDK